VNGLSLHHLGMDHAPGNFGTSQAFPSVRDGALVRITNNVQLVSMRVKAPLSWVVTLTPCTNKGAQQVPWVAQDWAGIPEALPVFGTTPYVPTNGYKVRMTWGSGGVRSETLFDYPMAGATFGVVAETLDLSVQASDPSSVDTVDDESLVPVFGAFMVPGEVIANVAVNRTEEVAQSTPAHTGETVRWPIPFYARELTVWNRSLDNASTLYSVRFENTAGMELLTTWNAQDAGSENTTQRPIIVPAQAERVAITPLGDTGGGGSLFGLMWGMYFK
jgi:hypothetical protein